MNMGINLKAKFISIIILNFVFGIMVGMGIVSTMFRFENHGLAIIGSLCLILFLPCLVLVWGLTKQFYKDTNFRTNFQKRLEDTINYSHFD